MPNVQGKTSAQAAVRLSKVRKQRLWERANDSSNDSLSLLPSPLLDKHACVRLVPTTADEPTCVCVQVFGWENVVNVVGGMAEWRRAGYETLSSA